MNGGFLSHVVVVSIHFQWIGQYPPSSPGPLTSPALSHLISSHFFSLYEQHPALIRDDPLIMESAVSLLFFYEGRYLERFRKRNETQVRSQHTPYEAYYKLENRPLMDLLAKGLDFLSMHNSMAGVRTFLRILDERRRQGKLAKPWCPSQPIRLAVEACLRSTPACDRVLTATMAQMWFLLADTDRGEFEHVDISNFVESVCAPFIEESNDLGSQANGFMALSTMFYVNNKPASELLQSKGQVLQRIFDVRSR